MFISLMSLLDSLKPSANAILIVCGGYVEIEFARLPDSELLHDLDRNFNSKPGFCFGQGIVLGGVLVSAFQVVDQLEYKAGFPTTFNPLEVTQVIAQIFSNHGLTTTIKLSPFIQESIETKKIENKQSDSQFFVQLTREIQAKLTEIARADGRTESDIVLEAVGQWLAIRNR
jgi:hypothetical protein